MPEAIASSQPNGPTTWTGSAGVSTVAGRLLLVFTGVAIGES